MLRRVIGILLVLVLVLSVFTIMPINVSAYSVGDTIQYGNYPQSEVTDSSIVATLNALSPEWHYYKYYINSTQTNYMKYCDVFLNGNKYRGVYFSQYRPRYTDRTSWFTNQQDNGYSTSTIYWFKYEPISWKVLDPVDGLIISDYILDSQDYYQFYEERTIDGVTVYPSNYYYSSIREWLNTDFYNTAFVDTQKTNITISHIETKSSRYTQYNSPESDDKIFLLSHFDISSTQYGFASTYAADTTRLVLGTDYAKVQGLSVFNNSSSIGHGYSRWRLRSPDDNRNVSSVYYDGSQASTDVGSTEVGVRPACRLKTLKSDYSLFNQSNSVDDYLIEQVRKYTADNPVGNTVYNHIMNSNYSNEAKLGALNELFKNYGFTNAKEGINYLIDNNTYRKDYQFLTTNEIYCAYDFFNWLNNSTSGKAARGLLWADGLLLNSELTSYLDVTTYINYDTPGIKKNKELLRDFLAYQMPKVQLLGDSKKVASYLGKIIKLNNIVEDAELDEIMNNVLNATSESDLQKWQNQFAKHIKNLADAGGSNKIYIEGDQFAKALGYSTSILSFASATADDIYSMINLNHEIEKYTQYSNFLTTIMNCEYASDDMRLAAFSLLDDIKNGYLNRVVRIFGNIFTLDKDILTADIDLWEETLGANGALFGEALSTISLGAFVSNIIIDTGDFVKKAAYVQGYAELSTIYCNILQQDKTAFLNNQTAENAWKFFEDYSTLWSLRYSGEESYLKMNELKVFVFGKVKSSDYTMKSAVVNDNLSLLIQKKFDMAGHNEIPSSVQYFSKSVIACPVDVYVYNQDGELVATLKDGVESDISNEYGRFAVMKQSYSGEYAKVIALNNPDSVVIKSVAHSQGLVDYSIAAVKNNEVTTYSLNNISVTDGSVITTSNNSSTYSLDYTGDETNVVEGQMIEVGNEYVAVETIVSDISNVDLQVGEKQLLSVSITPDNATNQTVDWYTDKEDIVSIKNGVVEALKPGVATVYVKAIDTDDVILPFVVNVIPQATITGHSLSLNGDIGINFYVDVPDEDVSNGKVKVNFAWTVDGTENTHSVTLSANDKYELGYKASCPVAVAEMTYDVTATVTIDGVVQSVPDTYSIQKYAKAILNNENDFKNKYIAAENNKGRDGAKRYDDLITLVQTMLDYGTKAQITFNRDVNHPANDGTDFFADAAYSVSPDMITVTEENMDMDLSEYGLRYKGSTVVYLSETSIRHYYYVDDWDSFNAIRNNVIFDGVAVTYTEKDGAIYFEKKGVSASNLDTPYTLTIKDKSCKFAVNDYIRHCLESDKVSDNTKALVRATYRYNVAANAFFEV